MVSWPPDGHDGRSCANVNSFFAVVCEYNLIFEGVGVIRPNVTRSQMLRERGEIGKMAAISGVARE